MDKEMLKTLQELLEDHSYIFMDDEFIDTDDIEDRIVDHIREYLTEDDDYSVFSIYAANEMDKPNLTIEHIGQILEDSEYSTENAWGMDLVEEDKETLDKMNDLMHSIIGQLYMKGYPLLKVTVYSKGHAWNIEVLEGERSYEFIKRLIDNHKPGEVDSSNRGNYYCKLPKEENGINYIAVFNESGGCFVEEYKTLADVLKDF